MKRSIIHADIVTTPADAMIYSTNVRLALTGGVGAALVRQFGIGVQIQLQDSSLGTGRQLAEVGEIFTTRIVGSPWKQVFHAIATDEIYHTEVDTVRSILRSCFRRCEVSGHLRNLVCSALGTGYGDLDLSMFFAAASEVCDEFEAGPISSFSIVVRDIDEYNLLCDVGPQYTGWAHTA